MMLIFVSIPKWCDSKNHTNNEMIFRYLFQFQSGAIQSKLKEDPLNLQFHCFNSKVVRFKEIDKINASMGKRRFNSKVVRFKVKSPLKSLKIPSPVSIPKWCDSKMEKCTGKPSYKNSFNSKVVRFKDNGTRD